MNKCVISIFTILFILVTFATPHIEAQAGGYERKLYIDPQIPEFFEERESVRIIVELIDESGIVLEGTKEERREQLNKIDDWFKPEVDKIVSNYESDEGIDITKKRSRGFGAIVTEEGFWKLANDSRISAIHYDAPTYGLNNLTSEEINTTTNVTYVSNEISAEPVEFVSDPKTSKTLITIIIPVVLLILIILIIIVIKLTKTRESKKR
ncbi:hypothetical protein A3K73_06260 [Candidatus Pacearchaeota archaeon RBG_13_36_9]|nr:MAG: hypothetical protein A3K73_06260 [Candidatus Pacearchaeota archaeon RBG_13_36_9]